MSATIGGTIKLEGESEYRKALSTINQQIKTTASELSLLAVQYDKGDESIEKYTSRNKTLEKEISQQEEKIALLRGALEQAADTYGETDTKTQKYQQSLNKAQAELIKMQREVEENNKAIDDFGKETVDSSKDVDKLEKSIDDFGKEAIDSSKDVKKLENSVDDAGDSFEGLEKAGGIAVAGITAVIAAAAAGITTLFSLAESTRETQTALSKLEQSYSTAGIDFDYATDTIFALQGVVGDLDRSVEASNLLAKVSKDEKVLAENTRILTGVFAEYGDSIPIEGLAEGIAATAEMASVQGVLADALEWQGINLDDYNAKLEAMNSAEERAAYTRKVLIDLYGKSADAYRENNRALIEANEAQLRLDWVLSDIGASAEPLITELKNTASRTLMELAEPMQTLSGGLISALTGGENAEQQISEGLGELVGFLVETTSQALPVVSDVAIQLIPSVITSLLEEAPKLLQTVFDIAFSVLDMLRQPEVLPAILQEVAALLPQITLLLLENAPLLFDCALTLFLTLVECLPEVTNELTDALPDLVQTVISTLVSNAPVFLTAGIQIFMGLLFAMQEVAFRLWESAPLIIGSIIDGLGDGWSKMKEIGGDLLKGIWEGIKAKMEWLKQRIREFGSTILENIKDVFGIHSPSTVMRDEVGGYMAEGVGVGFLEGMEKVNADIKNALPTDYSVGINAAVNGDIQTSYMVTTLEMFKAALSEYSPVVILDEKAVGKFVLSTVSREVFA